MVVISESQVKENLDYWENRYKKRHVEWHIEEVHPALVKYLSLLTRQNEKKTEEEQERPLKFFLPLCGKTKDIPFLLNLGFEVFGAEAVSTIIDELNQENNLDLIFDKDRSLYHTKDEKLKIYCGDMFKCPIEEYGPFDCVWDRASFIAPDYHFREVYMEIMRRSVAHGTNSGHEFRYLLQSVKYDKSRYPGPPRCVDEDDIQQYFGSWAKVTKLECTLVPEDHPCRQVAKYVENDFFEEFHLIENKD